MPSFKKTNPVQKRFNPKKRIELKTGSRHVIYTREFREFVRRNPGAIGEIARAFREMKRDVWENPAKGIRVKMLEPGTWKVTAGKKTLLVKRRNPGSTESGARNVLILERLKKIAKNYPHIETIKYHLGWTDGKNGFLVTDFHELKTMLYSQVPKEIWDEFLKFRAEAKKQGIYDVEEVSAFYEPEKRRIIVFDPRE